MFIFPRSFGAVAAGLGVALLVAYLDSCRSATAYPAEMPAATTRVRTAVSSPLVPRAPPGVSSAPVRELSLSCRLPPASFASRLPSLKSRIVPDQVAACTPI
jgi:hypothetical protein